MATIFLTGVSGYLGLRIARSLARSDAVDRLVGIDIQPVLDPPAKLEFHRRDVREPFVDLLDGVDTALHLAWILNPSGDPALETSVNLGGTRNFLAACATHSPDHVVALSSATAYGALASNPVPILESQLVRPDQPFQYAREKAQMEGLFRQFGEFHPDCKVTLLRPCVIVGPGADNYITQSLTGWASTIVAGRDPPWQFLHEDDLVLAVTQVVLQGLAGTYNVAPDGLIPISELAALQGQRVLRMGEGTAKMVAGALWKLKIRSLAKAPPEILPFLSHPWAVDGTALREALGVRYAYDSLAAFRDYARAHGRRLIG